MKFSYLIKRAVTGSVLLCVMLFGLLPGEPRLIAGDFAKLSYGCKLLRRYRVPQHQVMVVSRKLGAPIAKLSNNWLLVQGRKVQVNIIEAPNDKAAERVYQALTALKSDPAFVVRRGRKLFEFVCRSPALAIKSSYELGVTPKPDKVIYQLTLYLAPVKMADPIIANRLFNLFLTTPIRHPAPWQRHRIARLKSKIKFGNSLKLRGAPAVHYRFSPQPVQQKHWQQHAIGQYDFNNLPQIMNIPYIKVNVQLTCDKNGWTATARQSGKGLIQATQYWPVNDPDVIKLVQQITRGKKLPRDKVAAILAWLTPGRHIKFGGVTGSRWGVKRVLRQRYGQCWDFSDCFITLCRAAGVPCRQVAGWLYGSGGHVWAEYLIPGQGWQQVDPTGGGILSCGIYHIPYFVSEDGDMAILYLTWPKIKLVNKRKMSI